MVILISRTMRRTSRHFVLAALTALLFGCGGGSGDTDLGETDADADGIPDIDDPFVDVDPVDGLDDLTGLTEAEVIALSTNTLIPTASQPCGNQPASATDNNSSTASWDDNCLVARAIRSEAQGAFLADSLYAVGIQRVIFCLGFGNGASYTDFADGEYAELSEAAMQQFQSSEGLVADGLVGPASWGALESQLELLNAGTLDGTGQGVDTYGFTTERCNGIPMFYQTTSLASDGINIDVGGWSLARNQPNQGQTTDFSFERPFNRL